MTFLVNIGSTYNSGDDIATALAVSDVSERSDVGLLASPLLSQERERQVRTHADFITLIESSGTSLSHFRYSTVKSVARGQNKRKPRDKSSISLKCELAKLFEVKELLKQSCLRPNIIRGGFLRNKRCFTV